MFLQRLRRPTRRSIGKWFCFWSTRPHLKYPLDTNHTGHCGHMIGPPIDHVVAVVVVVVVATNKTCHLFHYSFHMVWNHEDSAAASNGTTSCHCHRPCHSSRIWIDPFHEGQADGMFRGMDEEWIIESPTWTECDGTVRLSLRAVVRVRTKQDGNDYLHGSSLPMVVGCVCENTKHHWRKMDMDPTMGRAAIILVAIQVNPNGIGYSNPKNDTTITNGSSSLSSDE
mmetsp:Transcript_2513/g.4575  ORF Transcript_2513/g.4575 Transcript_2513/m.4575 type:complete len:226 (-) Transcript_2513:468-1145(-)